MGGTGKTTLLTQWIESQNQNKWTGIFWYTFPETEGDRILLFFQKVLKFALLKDPIDGVDINNKKLLCNKFLEYAENLSHPYLIVLDSFEQILLEYSGTENVKERDFNKTTDPADTELLQALFYCKKIKTCITSRIVPDACKNDQRNFFPNIEYCKLKGLSDEANYDLFINSNTDEKVFYDNFTKDDIKEFLEKLGDHPLSIITLSGVIKESYGGNFNRWYEIEGKGLLDNLDVNKTLSEKVNKILSHSIKKLPEELGDLLAYLAFFPEGTKHEDIDGFYGGNSNKLSELKGGLRHRELISFHSDKDIVVLHPLIRKIAIDSLDDQRREKLGSRVAAYFERKIPSNRNYSEITSPDKLRDELTLISVYTKMRDEKRALERCSAGLLKRLNEIEAYHTIHAITAPLTTAEIFERVVDYNSLVRCFHYYIIVAIRWKMNYDTLVVRVGEIVQEILKKDNNDKLGNLGKIFDSLYKLADAKHQYPLAKKCCNYQKLIANKKNDSQLLQSALFNEFQLCVYLCDTKEGKRVWDSLDEKTRTSIGGRYWYSRFVFVTNRGLFTKKESLTDEEKKIRQNFEDDLKEVILETETKDPLTHRWALYLLCEWYYNYGEYEIAEEWLKNCVALVNAIGEFDEFSESTLAMTQKILNRPKNWTEEAERLRKGCSKTERYLLPLARLYLSLGEREKAKELAIKQYTNMHGIGNPYIRRHYFEQAKRFLLTEKNEDGTVFDIPFDEFDYDESKSAETTEYFWEEPLEAFL